MSAALDRLCLKRCQRQCYQLLMFTPFCCYSLLYILYWETLVPVHFRQDSRLFYRQKKGDMSWDGEDRAHTPLPRVSRAVSRGSGGQAYMCPPSKGCYPKSADAIPHGPCEPSRKLVTDMLGDVLSFAVLWPLSSNN